MGIINVWMFYFKYTEFKKKENEIINSINEMVNPSKEADEFLVN